MIQDLISSLNTIWRLTQYISTNITFIWRKFNASHDRDLGEVLLSDRDLRGDRRWDRGLLWESRCYGLWWERAERRYDWRWEPRRCSARVLRTDRARVLRTDQARVLRTNRARVRAAERRTLDREDRASHSSFPRLRRLQPPTVGINTARQKK